jgi:hypothetical protein
MVASQSPGAGPPPQDRGKGDRGGNGWPVVAACIPMLAGAATLVLTHRAGVTFLILFTSCTAIMALLMAGNGHAYRK